MSVENFIPQLWSAQILLANRKNQVFRRFCNTNYQGMITAQGDRVKINTIGPVTVSTYTKNSTTVSYQDLADASQWLVIDQAKYFAFGLDDVDAAQANADLMAAAMNDASYRLSDTADQYIAGLYAQAGVTTSLGTTASPTSVTSSNVVTYMAQVARRLSDANCPEQDRWMVVPPWFHLKLRLAKIVNEVTTDAALIDGAADRVMGFSIFVSNNVATSGSATKVLAGTTSAITYADQIVKTEALRLSTSFEDGIRGLHVYGAKVVKSDCLACFSCSEGSES